MAEQKISEVLAKPDVALEMTLRPSLFSEFTGQARVKERLEITVAAAKGRHEAIDHILLNGPPGLGKTTLANILAKAMGANLKSTSGPTIEKAGDLAGLLTNLEEGDVLFIDEIHRLSKSVEEFLYPAMESFKIDFIVDKGPHARTINFNLKPFTLIGATTRSGLLASPLRDRFGILHHLDFYEPEDLAGIITNAAQKLSLMIDTPSAFEIARRSRGTPRIAIRLLKRVRDFAEVNTGVSSITLDQVLRAMESLKVDEEGLDEFSRKILRVIVETYSGGPVGVEALAATLNEEVDTIADVVEPYLLKAGFLRRTSRGRETTEKARKHIVCSKK